MSGVQTVYCFMKVYRLYAAGQSPRVGMLSIKLYRAGQPTVKPNAMQSSEQTQDAATRRPNMCMHAQSGSNGQSKPGTNDILFLKSFIHDGYIDADVSVHKEKICAHYTCRKWNLTSLQVYRPYCLSTAICNEISVLVDAGSFWDRSADVLRLFLLQLLPNITVLQDVILRRLC